MKKSNKAITLIALIITIIVLLILAGVTINMLMGENGIVNKAKTSVAKYENAQTQENTALDRYEVEIDNARGTVTISQEEYNRLLKSSNTNNYLTDEQVIGTWINGKPLYQKTINCGGLSDKSQISIPHGIENIDYIVNAYGVTYASSPSYGYYQPLSYVHDANTNCNISLDIGRTHISISNRLTDKTVYDVTYVTLQYTKTSDPVPAT